MNAVERNTKFLIASIQRCNIYKEYKKHAEMLRQNPEWVTRVNHFRAENYRLQNETDREALLTMMDQLEVESAELRRIPEINAFLDSELALCRLMQQVCKELAQGVELDVPEI